LATQVKITYVHAMLEHFEARVNAEAARLEAAGGEVLSVQVINPTASTAGAVLVVRTTGDPGNGALADDDMPTVETAPRGRAENADRTARDYELGRRLQEERALQHRVRRLKTGGRADRSTKA
jgi:hypothetical protein